MMKFTDYIMFKKISRHNGAGDVRSRRGARLSSRGFTLIEILVVLGISVILATGGFLALWNLKKHQALQLSAEKIVAVLRDAQARSVSQENGLVWGVHFENSPVDPDSYWIFGGDPAVPIEKVSLSPGVVLDTPSTNVTFAKVSGLPGALTAVKIKLSTDDTSIRTININVQGTIEQK